MLRLIEPGPQPQSNTETPAERYGRKNWPCDSIERFDMKLVAFCECPGVYDSVFIVHKPLGFSDVG